MSDKVLQPGAFLASLQRNNKEIRLDRAQAIGEDAELIYKRKVEDLRVSIKKLERDQENMLDLSPDSAYSLKLASDFDGIAYADKDLELGFKIRDAKIRLQIAEERFRYLFGKEV